VADARVLVDRARVEAQVNKITYDESIPVDTLVKKICDFKQNFTQYGGVRPFGTSLLIAGIDSSGTHLFETDPSGALMAYKAGSIGSGRNEAMSVFDEKYKDGMSRDEALLLGLEALYKATEGEMTELSVEIGLVEKDVNFRKLDPEEVSKYVKQYLKAHEGDEKPDGKSEGKSDAKPDAKPDDKPDAKPDDKPDTKPDDKPGEMSGAKSEARADDQ
jgi:proteasome alpha subunit